MAKHTTSSSGRPEWWTKHLWQIQPVRDVLVLLAVFGLLVLGAKLSLVTVPLLLAATLAYLFEPIVQRLTRVNWISRPGAAISIIATVVIVIVLPLAIAGVFAIDQGIRAGISVATNAQRVNQAITWHDDGTGYHDEALADLPPIWQRAAEYARVPHDPETGLATEADDPPMRRIVRRVIEWAQQQAGGWLALAEEKPGDVGAKVAGTGANIIKRAFALIKSTGVVVFVAFLTAFFFFFISAGYAKFVAFIRSLLPDKHKAVVFDIAGKIDRVIAGFIRGRITIMVIQMIVFTIGYFLIGAPAALLLGIGVGVLSIVPYLALIGIPVSIALMFLDPPSGFRGAWWWMIIAPIAVYQLGQMLDDYVLTPRIQGKTTDLDTPTVLFASIAGGILAGVYGLLIAIPLAASIKIIVRDVLWPRFKAWTEGREKDPLPIGTDD
ncbi:MAG: AI-2E family transporter [Phycisphaerales bacterium]|nr:AI-2E family transporter [Phycisphaerales bacterium]